MEKREHPSSSPEHPAAGHEKSDAHAMSIVRFGVGLAVVIFICLYAMARLADYFGAHQTPTGPPPSPLVKSRRVPPAPQLQISETKDLKGFLSAEDATLDSYGWVDKQNGIVKIPVDRAMDLLAQRGLPFRQDANPAEAPKKDKP